MYALISVATMGVHPKLGAGYRRITEHRMHQLPLNEWVLSLFRLRLVVSAPPTVIPNLNRHSQLQVRAPNRAATSPPFEHSSNCDALAQSPFCFSTG